MHLTVLVYWSVAISLPPLVDSFSQYFRVQTIMHHNMETKSRGWNELGVSEEKILWKKCSVIRTQIVNSLSSFICWGWHQLNMLCIQKHVILIKCKIILSIKRRSLSLWHDNIINANKKSIRGQFFKSGCTFQLHVFSNWLVTLDIHPN